MCLYTICALMFNSIWNSQSTGASGVDNVFIECPMEYQAALKR